MREPKHYKEVESQKVEEAKDTYVRWLIAEKEGAKNFFMRMFEVYAGGTTPFHSHSHEHEVFILEGEGELFYDGKKFPLREGQFIFIAPNKEHQFINTGEGILRFLCIIPPKV